MQEQSALNIRGFAGEERLSLSAFQTAKAYFDLTKPRITLLIAISTAVGYTYGTTAGFGLIAFVNAVLGASCMASGAAALNQWFERTTDAKMQRTKNRPLPSGWIRPSHALLFGTVLSVAGLLDLSIFVNVLAAGLGAGNLTGLPVRIYAVEARWADLYDCRRIPRRNATIDRFCRGRWASYGPCLDSIQHSVFVAVPAFSCDRMALP